MRHIELTCHDCAGDDAIFHGCIVSKGTFPLRYCGECGEIIDGVPSLFDSAYRWATGEWPWE